jgi:maleamate amidohydrolase
MTTAIEPIWQPFLTARDREMTVAAGFSQEMGYGRRPAMIVLDADQFGASPGEADVVRALGRLLRAARSKRLPVIFAMASDQLPAAAEIRPQSSDIVVTRSGFSAFCGTPLHSFMIHLGVDSLIVGGFGTSAAVRSTILEGFCANFRCALVADGCWDAIEISHAMSFYDLSAKHADLVSSTDCADFIGGLADGLFPNLPPNATERRGGL